MSSFIELYNPRRLLMPNPTQIKQTVQFTELTTVPKEQSENALFDIVQENVKDNNAYPMNIVFIYPKYCI